MIKKFALLGAATLFGYSVIKQMICMNSESNFACVDEIQEGSAEMNSAKRLEWFMWSNGGDPFNVFMDWFSNLLAQLIIALLGG